MKKLIYCISVSVALLSTSCSDFLDTENLYQKDLNSYYRTPIDIEEATAGVYNALYINTAESEVHIASNLLSDIMLAGGGPDDAKAQAIDTFQDPIEDTYKDLWLETYNGVYRCNAIIESMETNDYGEYFKTEQEEKDFRDQYLGEAYFMRGFLFFRGAKFFGGMPIIPTTDAPRDVERASYSDTFIQIISDIKKGADLMPSKSASSLTAQYGHANKWIAQGILARVYLFYTGYMANIEGQSVSDIALLDGTTLTKQDVIAALETCMNESGYAMLNDFRNLWPYSGVNKAAGTVVLPWADTEGLSWAGQDGFMSGNTEVMFPLRYAFGNWDHEKGQSYTNRTNLYFGIRDNSLIPFGQGWGWGSIHSGFANDWDDADIRKKGSILDLGDADQGMSGYVGNKGFHETGLVNKKYTNLQHDGADGPAGMFYYMYGITGGDMMQLWHAQDFTILRFADIYLMHAELAESAESLNMVRRRAGLADIAYSLDALKKERMYEFAFEGLRWFDLVRWGDVATNNNYFVKEIDVTNVTEATKYSVDYRTETKGLVSLPESEIRLSNGVYQQNPGWE